ncbi:TetR family transcriptional regulator [Nocardia sp. ET3-3]|uniref:TetR family transcriptional regulator n=1 Tax=Nocardia terrae TaxID=2675851 RepID=A0A7K1US82_9NOCA|nr:TetR/AcrR family transcriptional regulator [Nocardia terrae]MVU77185.1 TetR family transcriptional regulator [Nocardia terrae]
MSRARTPYHHGDLPAALVRAAIELLEEGGSNELSLRAAARRAGVSIAAPYRHFADRQALLSAVAAVGYRELAAHLIGAHPAPETVEDLAAIAVAYVQFAMQRPGLFRVMFVEPTDPDSPDQVAAVDAIHEYLRYIVGHAFPDLDPDDGAKAMWSVAHGLAFLHLDNKLDASSPEIVADTVRRVVRATLAASGRDLSA